MNISNLIPLGVLLSVISFIAGIKYQEYLNRKATKIYTKKLEDYFKSIYDQKSKLKFSKRINNYIYFHFTNNTSLIYEMKKRETYIYEGDTCVFTSTQINKELNEKLMSYLDTHFYSDINLNVINVNGSTVSMNVLQVAPINIDKPKKVKKYLNMDNILDKINKEGMDKLTKDEIAFLQNKSNEI